MTNASCLGRKGRQVPELSLRLAFQSTGQCGNKQWCPRSPDEGNRNQVLSWQQELCVHEDSLKQLIFVSSVLRSSLLAFD